MHQTKTFLVIFISLFIIVNVSAQNRNEGNSSKAKSKTSKTKGFKYQKFNREEKKKTSNKSYDSVKNALAQKGKTVVRPTRYHGQSQPLRELAARKRKPLALENRKIEDSDKEPLSEDVFDLVKRVDGPASFVQTETFGTSAATLGTSFESTGAGLVGYTTGLSPSDAVLAVGPNHIVSWVNNQFAIFDKTGTMLTAPVFSKILFEGIGNLCESFSRGDPMLQYDSMADRWFFSEFSFGVSGGSIAAPYLQCVAISTTNDPTGSFHIYTISFGSTAPDGFNDYGKLGIWNDAYYTSYNIFEGSPAGDNSGVALCASDRTKMLVGDPTAETLCAPTAFYAGGAAFLPADLDGDELPTDLTRGGLFMRYSPSLNLRFIRLKPDFSNSTVTVSDGYGGNFINLPTGATIRACNDAGNACIEQPDTTAKLQTLGRRLMHRLVYRNRGGVDSLVINHSVDPDGAGTRGSAIRWYEVRNPLNNPDDSVVARRPYIYQNGTYDPGAVGDRWMGSMAMNKFGDIMVGYSLVDAVNNVKPSIVVAGRSQCDSLNTLQPEIVAQVGGGSQTGSQRWGDYSTMQVDPVDDSTFWYTTQYLTEDGTSNWHTRIVSFSFPTTTAMTDGDFNVPSNWSNGVPNSITTGTIPSGRTLTVNTDTTVCNLNVESGSNLVMNANLDVNGSLMLGDKIDTEANTLGLACNATVSGASSSNYVIGNIRKDFCQTEEFNYPTGSISGYSPATVNVTNLATIPSSLEIKATQANRSGMDATQSASRYWELSETGDLTANLTFNYLETDVNGTESNYKLFRFVGSSGSAVTPFNLDTTANKISTDGISSFSDWAVGQLNPTIANVSISGIVLRSNRRAIPNAFVRLTDAQGNIKTARSNSFGYFKFADVSAGQNYIIDTTAKGVKFSSQVLSVEDDITRLEILETKIK